MNIVPVTIAALQFNPRLNGIKQPFKLCSDIQTEHNRGVFVLVPLCLETQLK